MKGKENQKKKKKIDILNADPIHVKEIFLIEWGPIQRTSGPTLKPTCDVIVEVALS